MHHPYRTMRVALAPGYNSEQNLFLNFDEHIADVILLLKGFSHFRLSCVSLEHVMRVDNFGQIPMTIIMT
jgi:hypothetical protein